MSTDRTSIYSLRRARSCKLSCLLRPLFLRKTVKPTSLLTPILRLEGALIKVRRRNSHALYMLTAWGCACTGFEGLTSSPSGDSLYALLQSATVQDGGLDKAKNRYTRLLKYDVHNLNNIKLDEEYIVPLPQSSKPNTLAQSEFLWLNKNQFLVLARDGNGAGGSNTKSKYKCVSPLCAVSSFVAADKGAPSSERRT
jgi:hypothetical protein